jgi:hypothetical protein
VLNIEFKHEFCRFTVDVEVGSGFYKSSKDNPISAVYFTNATGAGYFNVKTGQFSNTSEVKITASAGTHTAGTSTESGRYVTGGDFMAPGNQSVTVCIVAGREEYRYAHPAYTFESGKNYTLKVKVEGASVDVTGVNKNEWGNGGSTDISTH